jgi:invasion protein IalB
VWALKLLDLHRVESRILARQTVQEQRSEVSVRRQRASVAVLVLFVSALALVRVTGAFTSEAAAPIQAQLGRARAAEAPGRGTKSIDAWAVSCTPTTVNGTL